MRPNRFAAVIWSLVGLLAVSAARAQERGLFSIAAMAGVDGAFDSEGDRTFDHAARELVLSMRTGDSVWTSLRFGNLALGDEEMSIGRLDSKIDFVAITGENRFRQEAYDFGIFLGLGRYQLDADLLAGGSESEDALGVALGFTGDFDVTRRISIVAEIDAHYVFFEETNFYGAALAGVAVHF